MSLLREIWVNVLGAAASFVLGGIAAFALHRGRLWWRQRGQRALLSGLLSNGDGPIFVFPPREGPKEAILPQISIEDFMAINNLVTALLMVGWNGKIRVRTPDQLSDRERARNHLILICSSKTNKVTKLALEKLCADERIGSRIPRFCEDKSLGEWVIKVGGMNTHRSPSFEEIRDLSGDHPNRHPDLELHDLAMIIKARNPWSTEGHRILIVAGMRGFGTWGAAEWLKKRWKALYRRKQREWFGSMSKDGDFAALVGVTLRNCDIKLDPGQVSYFQDLDERQN